VAKWQRNGHDNGFSFRCLGPTSHDVLSGILRDGAQRLLAEVIEAELTE